MVGTALVVRALVVGGLGVALSACGGTTTVEACTGCGLGGYAGGDGLGGHGGAVAAGGAGSTSTGASGGGGGAQGGGGPGTGGGAPPCGDLTFAFTETAISLVAPATAKYMHVKAWGAGGNAEKDCHGGLGGYSEGVFAVQPSEKFTVIVGGAGTAGAAFGYEFGFGNTGGGGLSGIFRGADPIDENGWPRALLVAGGGGGDGVEKAGGPCIPGIPGNHPSAGGSSTMLGGLGLDDAVNGGGGGYRGGLGGAVHEAGVGGTGFPADDAANKPSTLVASLLAHAEIGAVTAPHANDPDYDGHAGTSEHHGHVVVHFKCEPPPIDDGL